MPTFASISNFTVPCSVGVVIGCCVYFESLLLFIFLSAFLMGTLPYGKWTDHVRSWLGDGSTVLPSDIIQ
jgi:hypothetical protein